MNKPAETNNLNAEPLSRESEIILRLKQCLPRFAASIEPEQALSELGFDSFDLVELLCLVEEEFRVRLEDEDFHRSKTVGDLVGLIARNA